MPPTRITSSTTSLKESWLYTPNPKANARGRLFCFPYAGGGPSSFRQWPEAFDKRNSPLELQIISLPGHEFRITSPPINHLDTLVPMLSKELEKQLDLPFYFFGYSLGALIAFEVARHFQQHGKKAPEHLFVCAKSAPHLPLRHPPIYQLPDQQLIQELKRFDGTPSDVLENQQLMELFLPCLRADFSLNETYKYMDEAPLSCPITAFGGESDEEATTEMLQAWKIHTGSSFQVKTFTGGHFFVTDHLEKIIAEIDRLSSVRK